MTFNEWKESLTDEQRAAMDKHVDKFGESGIIKNIRVSDIHNLNYKGSISKEVTSEIDKALKDYNSEKLFTAVNIVKTKPTDVLQTNLVKNGAFFDTVLNINENALGGKTVQEIDAMFKSSNSTIANSLADGVIHEKYHAKLVDGLNYAQAEALYEALAEIHIEGLSEIAYNDGAECIAEVGVMIENGQIDKIPDEALKLFKKYLGE